MSRIFIIAAIFLIACKKPPVQEMPTYPECSESSGINLALSNYWEISMCGSASLSLHSANNNSSCWFMIQKDDLNQKIDTTFNDEIKRIRSQKSITTISEGYIKVSGNKARFYEYNIDERMVSYECFFMHNSCKYSINVIDSRKTYGRDKPEIEKLIGSIIIK